MTMRGRMKLPNVSAEIVRVTATSFEGFRRMICASEASGFIRFIYGLTQPFVMPFLGIFGEPSLGASVFEWASLIAIAIYMLLAYGISRIIELMYAPRVTR